MEENRYTYFLGTIPPLCNRTLDEPFESSIVSTIYEGSESAVKNTMGHNVSLFPAKLQAPRALALTQFIAFCPPSQVMFPADTYTLEFSEGDIEEHCFTYGRNTFFYVFHLYRC